MPEYRAAARITANTPWFVAVVGAITVTEVALRTVVWWVLGPAATLLVPPILAVVGLGALVPRLERALNEDTSDGDPDSPSSPRPSALGIVAVLGHAFALLVGLGTFVLVDTPVSALLYWIGITDGPFPVKHLLVSPLIASVAIVAAWVVPATAAVQVARGNAVVTASVTALRGAFYRPRQLASSAALYGLCVPGAAVLAGVGLVLTAGLGLPDPLLFLGSAVLLAIGGVFPLAYLTAHTVARTRSAPGTTSPLIGDRWPGTGRLVVGILVLTCLVTTAGVVRVAEHRPVDTTAEPLPDDPDALYATARENTFDTDHELRVSVYGNGSEPFIREYRVDRSDRQFTSHSQGQAASPPVYATTGFGAPPRRGGLDDVGFRACSLDSSYRARQPGPSYFVWMDGYSWDDNEPLSPPAAAFDGWTVTNRTEQRIVLELTAAETVANASVQGRSNVTQATEAQLRAVIDRERGTLDVVDLRFNGTIQQAGSTRRVDIDARQEFAVDVDVERPTGVGGYTLDEMFWRLMVY